MYLSCGPKQLHGMQQQERDQETYMASLKAVTGPGSAAVASSMYWTNRGPLPKAGVAINCRSARSAKISQYLSSSSMEINMKRTGM